LSYADIAVLAASAVLSNILLKSIIGMLCSTDKSVCFNINYRGKILPAIGGIVFVPVLLAAISLLLVFHAEKAGTYLGCLILALCMGFSGVVDDLVGDTNVKGLFNHIRCTLKGRMTTGFLKAFTGFAVSAAVSFVISRSYIEFIINAFIISLAANTLNLFDLRPGRAVKVFLAASLLLLAVSAARVSEALPIMALGIAALLYMPYDLKEICMLGDTGANILGISLGYYCALLLGFEVKLVVLAVLAAVNIVSEKLSINEIINGSRLLSYLDNLGREHREKNDKHY
jgi:UDP-GlcNAc:undecaprenyl-phosphate GlcNAc-1-phosphate transferase